MPAQKYVDNKYSLKSISMEPLGIPANNSQQHLMNDTDAVDTSVPNLNPIQDSDIDKPRVPIRIWLSVCVLCYVNLINYMDRYTVAGILTEITDEFGVSNSQAGLLQTVFVISYMVFAPLFGYLGDRYNRKLLMAFGVILWSLTTLIGSFMPNYHLFIAFRAMVGIGEASYSTIAPTIISDIFVSDLRSKMLALFYFAIPVGSGLGYIIGSSAAHMFGNWRYGLRVTPCAGFIAVLAIIFLLVDPQRGEIEGKNTLRPGSYLNDIRSLSKNKSFMLSTLGFTCVSFVTGALAWWGPHFISLGQQIINHSENADLTEVSLMFGTISMLAGIVGVPLGSMLATKMRHKFPAADPLICSFGLFVSAPLIFAAIVMANTSATVVYFFVFFGSVALNLNWAIVADMLLYVVLPTRRSSAEAFQILISHALGDAGSPYFVGLISDALKVSLEGETVQMDPKPSVQFKTLQYALFTTCFVEIVGAICFLITSFYIIDDRELAIIESEGMENTKQPTNHIYADDPHLSSSEANLAVS